MLVQFINHEIEQLDRKLKLFRPAATVFRPEKGWIHEIREALHMSLRQLGNRLQMTAQSVRELELREAHGGITLNSLAQAGKALDMEFVYGFVPKNKSLAKIIELKSVELAGMQVKMHVKSIETKGKKVSKTAIDKAILNKARRIKSRLPKTMWD